MVPFGFGQARAAGDGGVFICGTWLVDTYDQEAKKEGVALSNGYSVRPFPQIYAGSPRVWADGHSWVLLKQDLSDAQRDAVRAGPLLSEAAWERARRRPAFAQILEDEAAGLLPRGTVALRSPSRALLAPARTLSPAG